MNTLVNISIMGGVKNQPTKRLSLPNKSPSHLLLAKIIILFKKLKV
jgi:hypothetical protein